jgi:adenylate cyclase
VGISTGYAIVGTIARSRQRLEYTAIGDTMNLAPRLENLTKEYEVPIVISETTQQHLAGRIPTRELGDIVVKGTEQPVKVFAVLSGGT